MQFQLFSRKGAALVVLAAALYGGAASTTANAYGGDCDSWRETDSRWGPDGHRVGAMCEYVNSNSKARGILDINAANDYETSWFTRTNYEFYSGWTTCYNPFTCNNTRMGYAAR